MIDRRFNAAALLLALSLAVTAGCSGGSSGDSADPDTRDTASPSGDVSRDSVAGSEACALLSEIEVSEVVGTEVGSGRGSSGGVATGGSQSTCEWSSLERPADTAKLTVYSETTAADSVKDADPDAEPLPGIGDEAFVGSYASVWVYKGDRSFMAQWYSMMADDEENLPRSEALARLAADRL